jgi:hypothetical protein
MPSTFTYRNFLNQTGNFDADWTISVDNTTGSGSFGISGNKLFLYTLKNGEVYDPYGNILESYTPNSSFTIKNSVSNGKDTLYFNQSPKYFFKSSNFFQNHNYNYFVINPSGLNIDFDFFIRGESTTLNLGFLNPRYRNDNTNEIVNDVTGLIQNLKTGLNVKIFTGNTIAGSQLSVSLGNADGSFATISTFGISNNAVSLASGTFNAGSTRDIVTADGTSGTVSVYLGNSNGSYKSRVSYALGSNISDVNVTNELRSMIVT